MCGFVVCYNQNEGTALKGLCATSRLGCYVDNISVSTESQALSEVLRNYKLK